MSIKNKIIDYILDKAFESINDRIPKELRSVKQRKINKFYSVKNSKEYKDFEYKYLKEYYGEQFFTETKYGLIPVFSLKYQFNNVTATKIRSFDKLADKSNIDFSFNVNNHKGYKKNRYYKSYNQIVGENINSPDRPGFMLDRIELNNYGEMIKFKGYLGSYAENVYSNHVLEYELYKLFKQSEKKNFKELFKMSNIRNNMHKIVTSKEDFNNQMTNSLCTGDGRNSLLSVQMLVLIKCNNDYKIEITQRSKKVSIAPGCFQLVPSGGFEILNNDDSEYSKYELEDNYSPGCSIFREYLEEIFGNEEFDGNGSGSVNEILLKDQRIKDIENMLDDGRAELYFLGSVMDLSFLRHELSFALVIHDEKYNENKFIGNEECKNRKFISNVTLLNFEERKDIWENLHGPSAAMWMLFKQTECYKKLLESIKKIEA